jgi:hypothetical protein
MEPNDKDKEQLADKWLDAALKQYGEAEPRAGLEGRILASVRANDQRLVGWWQWPVAAAVAALLVAAIILMGRWHGQATQDVTANRPSIPIRAHSLNAASSAANNSATARKSQRKALARSPDADAPRLDQFPSPQPLSEQEKMLAHYVQARPEEARLVAQAQAELSRQDSLEFDKQRTTPQSATESPQ